MQMVMVKVDGCVNPGLEKSQSIQILAQNYSCHKFHENYTKGGSFKRSITDLRVHIFDCRNYVCDNVD